MSEQLWWEADRQSVGDAAIASARRIEQNQSDDFERFHRIELLYDPNSPLISDASDMRRGGVQENIIASNVDANAASIATADVRARVMTDGADWHQQRLARRLELYAEEQKKTFKVMPKCRASYKESAKKGNGIVKVTQRFNKPLVEHVMVENMIVDRNETRNDRPPTHIAEWVAIDADVLIAEYPKFREQILAARYMREHWRIDARVFPRVDNQVMYLDSYRLPVGVEGEKGYKPGRHVKTLITGTAIYDKPYTKPFFPYAVMMFIPRAKSWYAIGGAERVIGIQLALNKRNWHIEKQNDNIALPTTFVRPSDANLAVKTSRIGAYAVIKGDFPHVHIPNAVSPETYKSRLDLLDAGNREFGQNQMATHGTKPAGLDSGVALREFKDQTSDRYSPQEQAYEDHVLDVVWLLLDVCKDLGENAPTMVRQGRFGSKKIRWKDVDMGDVLVQLTASSTLPRTPAGREQFIMELAQAGIISKDSVTRLLDHPDVESELSLYRASLDAIEADIDDIAEGNVVMPDTFSNLEMAKWRGQMEFNKWRTVNAPEGPLEILRSYVVNAIYIKSGQIGAQNQNAQPGAAAAPGQQPMPGQPPALPGMDPNSQLAALQGGAPMGPAPQAALSPQAMHLVAGTD